MYKLTVVVQRALLHVFYDQHRNTSGIHVIT